jgi:hypothetical protein
MKTIKEIKLPTVAKVELSLEAISKQFPETKVLELVVEQDINSLLKTFGEVAESLLRKKFITPTFFDVDKRKILSIGYNDAIKMFAVRIDEEKTPGNILFFEFSQLDELVQIGATGEDENDMTQFCFFIVK